MPPLDENLIAELVRRRVVSDTFRRLPPEKKQQVYAASIRLFGRYGYDGLAVDRICRDAGISKGSFFQYFATKSHLLEFCLLVFDDRLAGLLEEIRTNDTAGLARRRLAYLYQGLLTADLTDAERQFYLFAIFGLRHAGVEIAGIDLPRHLADYIFEIISRGVETGEVRGDIEAGSISIIVEQLLMALVARNFSGGGEPADTIADSLETVLFDGIKR